MKPSRGYKKKLDVCWHYAADAVKHRIYGSFTRRLRMEEYYCRLAGCNRPIPLTTYNGHPIKNDKRAQMKGCCRAHTMEISKRERDQETLLPNIPEDPLNLAYRLFNFNGRGY